MELYTRTDVDPDIEVTIVEYTYGDVTIPVGFRSDGASSPRFLWSIIPPFKRTKKAAFVHDWNCKKSINAGERKEADRMFMEMLGEVSNINPVRCRLGYWGVRVGALLGIGIYYDHWTDKAKRFIRGY